MSYSVSRSIEQASYVRTSWSASLSGPNRGAATPGGYRLLKSITRFCFEASKGCTLLSSGGVMVVSQLLDPLRV